MILSTHTWKTLEEKEQEAQACSDGLTNGPKQQWFGFSSMQCESQMSQVVDEFARVLCWIIFYFIKLEAEHVSL